MHESDQCCKLKPEDLALKLLKHVEADSLKPVLTP